VWNEEECVAFKEGMEKVILGEEGGKMKGEEMEREMKRVIREIEKELGGMEEKRRGW